MFLKVDFHDNDFGLPVTEALKRLWRFIRENNDDLHLKYLDKGCKSFQDIFIKLEQNGRLLLLVNKAIDCENNWFDIEHNTRGLCSTIIKMEDQEKINPTLEVVSDYLNIKLTFHKDKKFTEKWNNGESAWLNLKTGEVGTF